MNSDLITEIKPSRSAPLFGFWYPGLSEPVTPLPAALKGCPAWASRSSSAIHHRVRSRRCATFVPHRGMPLSFGTMEGDCVKCSYHGWQFDHGRTLPRDSRPWSRIPRFTSDKDRHHHLSLPRTGRLRLGVHRRPSTAEPDRFRTCRRCRSPPSPYRMFHISTLFDCTLDDGIVGLMDPAHGPFVHQSSWWRTPGEHARKGQDL